ncbi:MAG: STAS domain-containing protein [candidate division Zixibacteria bacterium]|nr:STAS domain-containing protein [candidate division Zixibacteria bacterium]
MQITKGTQGDVAVLQIDGRLDLESSTSLKAATSELLEDKYNKVIFNLQGVDFINSSGLGALVSILKNVRSNQGRLKLTGLAPYVKEVFDITQLSNVFEIYADEQQAIGSF